MKRIKTIECGEQPPNDILTHILEVACKCDSSVVCIKAANVFSSLYSH